MSLLALSAYRPVSIPERVTAAFDKTATVTLSKATLQDKIKGGWAGQVIGCTFGGPTEFKFQGTMINDYQSIAWYDGYIKKTMTENPGLYDDVYMDLTFVDVFEKQGLDASVDAHAQAYANAGYMLWHANQVGRYNILHGLKAPKSGHWLNNPHADCIDYQIEADYSGLMSPGMPNTASAISDKIGHIMNYGDGWYGGVYVGAMYALAFTNNDIPFIVKEALKTIPQQSLFYQCISDVIRWHAKYPTDWKQTWFEIQRKYSDDVGCPDGVFRPFNIDATVNSAYVVLGLLYGSGDYTKTLEISTRAGQDSDCNPATAGGILGTVLGYSKIPAYWKQGLAEAENIDFKYTTMSLNDAYTIGLKHALTNIERNGGKVTGDNVTIAVQTPKAVQYEKSFEGHYPVKIIHLNKDITQTADFTFDGIGFVVRGSVSHRNKPTGEAAKEAENAVLNADLYIDGKLAEQVKLPVSFTTRRHELVWKYRLPKGSHQVQIKLINPDENLRCQASEVIVYGDVPTRIKL